MERPWYETFFEGLALDVWRKAVTPEQTRAECDFLVRELRLPPGGRVLDVPCGDGRHAIELAVRGYRLTGVDLSDGQIRAARARTAPDRGSVEWHQREMRDLPWAAAFDGCYCFGNSFGYIDPAGTRAFLHAVGRSLMPGARFAMDTGMAAECILPRFETRQRAQVEDILFEEENRYRLADGCIETTYTISRGEESLTRTGLQWVFTLREIGEMLRDAGLEIQSALGGVDGSAFTLGHPVVLIVAEKAA